MQKYKQFIKKFIWWYVGANIVIAILLAIFLPNIINKIVTGQQVTTADITNTVRVKQLGASVGLNNIDIAECPNDVNGKILACYLPYLNITHVTQLGLKLTDIQLLCVLNHEAIHKWQDDNNKIQYDSKGLIVNSKELEDYAYANDGC